MVLFLKTSYILRIHTEVFIHEMLGICDLLLNNPVEKEKKVGERREAMNW